MISLYKQGNSAIHRVRAGVKFLALMIFATGIFFVSSLWGLGVALAVVFVFYGLAGFGPKTLFEQMRVLWVFLALIFAVQGYFVSWQSAAFSSLRLIVLVLSASLLTLTTKSTDMILALEKGLSPFSRWVNISQFSLAIALVFRFIPLIAHVLTTIRQAQLARGGRAQIWHIAGPAIIHTLQMADEVAEAIDARSFDATPSNQTGFDGKTGA